ncbi:hypothetical protein [Methylobacterium sp. GXF4]|nr:hypothetical protein [Methylobacterium sp. GXF4]
MPKFPVMPPHSDLPPPANAPGLFVVIVAYGGVAFLFWALMGFLLWP